MANENSNLSGDFLSKKILLIDDSHSMRELTKSILHSEGFLNIDEAPHGQRGLEMYRECQHDILISDWNMPVMDGVRLYETIRDDANLKTPLFILLTSMTEKQHVMSAISVGIKYYIVKPYKPATLFQQVLTCLQKEKAA